MDGTIKNQQPDGQEIVASMNRAMIDEDGYARWSEVCYCPTPLEHERATVYDLFFTDISTNVVEDHITFDGENLMDYLARAATKQLQKKMAQHVAIAAFVLPEPTDPSGVINNGTISLLQTPKEKLLVTNHHVWNGFLDKRAEIPGLRLAIMGEGLNRPVDISTAELVDEDEGYDLAILRFEANDVIESIGKKFYKPKRWPLDDAIEGEDVAVVGFPGNRTDSKEWYLHFESVLLNLKVASVSDRKLLLAFQNPTPEIICFSQRPIDEFKWGGMSGSMVYRLDSDSMQFFVSGVLHGAGEGLDGSFFMSKASVIQEDGTIRL